MKNIRQAPRYLSESFARALILLNCVGAVAFYFAGPIHERMSPSHAGWLSVELRCLIMLINAGAASLIVARHRYLGIGMLFLTGGLLASNGLARNAGFGFAFVMSFWDAAFFLALELFFRRRYGLQSPEQT